MLPSAPTRSRASFLALTVVGPTSAADLSAPADVPLAELLPDLVRLVSADPEAAMQTGWALSRLGEAPLALDRTLAESRVRDGDMVYLRPVAETEPAVVVDLADSVADAVDLRGGLWTPGARRATLILVAAAALLLATLLVARDPLLGARPWAPLGIALLADLAAVLATQRSGPGVSTLMGMSSLVPWGVAGGLAGAFVDPADPGGMVAGAAVGVGVGAGAAALLVPATRGPAAGVALAVVPAGMVVAAGVALGASAGQEAAILAVWGVCLAAQLPLVVAALHLADIAGEEDRALAPAEVTARVDAAHRLLGWLSAGTAAGLAGALVVLGLSTEPWELALAGTAALAAALGSRRQRFLGQGLPPLLAALAGALCLELGVAGRIGGDSSAAVGLALLLTSAVALLALALAGGRRSASSALLRRQLRRLESLALVALLPLGLGALGVYTAIGDLGHRLG